MLLSSDPVMLGCQLHWLLSLEPRVQFGDCLQPRATCLPLAQQQTLILSAASLLSQEQRGQATADPRNSFHQPSARAKLLQLLELLASSKSSNPARFTVQQTARMAVQQHQEAPLTQDIRSENQNVKPPAVHLTRPALTAGALSAADVLPEPDRHQGAAAAATELENTGNNTKTAEYQQRQQQMMDVALPATKRVKFTAGAVHAPGSEPQPEQAAGPAAAAAGGGVTTACLDTSTVQHLILQLQELDSTCDARHIDVQLFQSTLAAAAAAAGARAGAAAGAAPAVQLGSGVLLQQFQQQLQQVSTEVLQPLLNALLTANSAGSTPGSTGCAGLPDSSVAYLLFAAVLPKLQQLTSAAPQTLLLSLVTVARSHLEVLVSVVVQPLVCSTGLIPAHVQLLSKLMKEVLQLPARVLQLLVMAAAGSQQAAATPGLSVAFTPPTMTLGPGSCWNDSHAVLMRTLTGSYLDVVTDQLDSVITAVKLAARRAGLSKSNSFGQLLMAIAKNYAGVMTKQQVEQLQHAAAATDTFMTRNITAKLQQLAAQHVAADDAKQL